MRQALFLCLGIVSVTWLGFEVFPGHTYLESNAQIYVPMLERLDAPGYLSRDPVATHPNLTYTIYDEATLFLHEGAGLNFKTALLAQQLFCRAAGVLGVFLLARGMGLDAVFAFLTTMLVNLGAALTGPGVALLEYEPVPCAFAAGLVLLAIGLLAVEMPLLAGLAAGVALLYDARTVAPFWIVILAAMLFDRRLRALLRPACIVFLIFLLLLANLAQLQPGGIEQHLFSGKMLPQTADVQRYTASNAWVSLWAGRDIWHYLVIWVCGLWATRRIWLVLNAQTRWLFVFLPFLGVVSVPVSYLLLEKLRWSLISQVQPARALLFTVAIASLACSVAGLRAISAKKNWEALLWFVVVFALPMKVRLLDLFRVSDPVNLLQLALCVALAGLLAISLIHFGSTKLKSAVLLVPLLGMVGMRRIDRPSRHPIIDREAIADVAGWANNNTWGSSMFLFPDAGRDLYPGMFRAESRRAVWVDWESGLLADYSESFANEWWGRWQQTTARRFSPERLNEMLRLPVDYYVVKRENQLADVKPAYQNHEFVVYDSRDLKNAATPFRRARTSQV
jgi:hypothetical protein